MVLRLWLRLLGSWWRRNKRADGKVGRGRPTLDRGGAGRCYQRQQLALVRASKAGRKSTATRLGFGGAWDLGVYKIGARAALLWDWARVLLVVRLVPSPLHHRSVGVTRGSKRTAESQRTDFVESVLVPASNPSREILPTRGWRSPNPFQLC